MKVTAFSKYLSDFLTRYLPGERGASLNTSLSYKDTFFLLVRCVKMVKGITPERLDLKEINKDNIVVFLHWIESEKKCSATTRNARLTALHSFFRYIQYEDPSYLDMSGQVFSITVKKVPTTTVTYLSLDLIKAILDGPDLTLKRGRRNLALILNV